MKNIKTPLGLFAIIYLTFGIVMNIRMFTEKMWPTYIFFISIGIGILLFGINNVTKRLPNYKVWQVIIGILPMVIFFIHTQIYDNQTETKQTSEKVLATKILLTETKLGKLNLKDLKDENMGKKIKSAFPNFQIIKSIGQQDGPDFNLYEVNDLKQEIFFISMDSYDTNLVQELFTKNKIIKDEYGIFVGQAIDSVIIKRPNLNFHSDVHYNIYATEKGSNIEYRLKGNFKVLNESEFVPADYSVEKKQIEGMTVEYLIWRK
jgi:hypothetical protein|tara:strand:+ start:63 stop:848 length:786 start_codon:yes stop_codon:yes gene_type:complete